MYILLRQDWLGKGDWFKAAYWENVESQFVKMGQTRARKIKQGLKSAAGP